MLPVGPEVAWEVGHYPSLGVQDFWGPKSDAANGANYSKSQV